MLYKLKENRVYRTYIGGRHIDEFFGKRNPENGFYPEDWTASTVKAFNPGREDIDEGEGKTREGISVKELVNGEMTCLVKLLDSDERLVIQVHPTVDFAKKYFNSKFGKTECWYFLDCADDAYVYLGFKEEISKDKWIAAVKNQNIDLMLSMLNRISVKNGDCILVEGGIPHAIGEGCFMIEVQEPSDLMGVVEKRTPSGKEIPDIKLHGGIGFDNMLKMFNYRGESLEDIKEKYIYSPRKISENVFEIIGKNETDKFSICLIRGGGDFVPPRKNGVIIVTQGNGKINGTEVKKGDRLFFNSDDKIVAEDGTEAVICC